MVKEKKDIPEVRQLERNLDTKKSLVHPFDDNFGSYIAGFVDGEGCFSVSFRYSKRNRVGIESTLSFSICQKKTATNLDLLEKIQTRFNGGSIRLDKTWKGLYKYETRSLLHIIENIVPFFHRFPLYTEKRLDFLHFCKLCSLFRAQKHRDKSGLLEIIQIAEKMNLSGQRKLSLAGLRTKLLEQRF